MKVSVIMPLYNKGPFVQEAIRSVLDQGFEDLEVVVVDDVSVDDSFIQVQSMEDPRVKLFKNEKNLGAAMCAQRAIDEAKGEYLIRLDADDLCVPDKIEKQVRYMDEHPEVGASGGYLQLFGDKERTWKFPEHDDDCKAQLLFGVPVSQGASIMRRSVIKENDIRYTADLPPVGEDWLYWLQWSKVSCFGNLQEPMTLYRRGEHNASFGRDKVADHKALFKRVFEFFDIPLSDEQLGSHLYTMKVFLEKPSAGSVHRFRAHLDHLKEMNKERKIFPIEAFEKRVERSWGELFFYLPQYGAGPVKAYKAFSGSLKSEERKYYFRYRVNKILGRA